MIRKAATLVLLLTISMFAIAQDQSSTSDLANRLGVSEDDLEIIERFQREKNRIVIPARAQIQVLQADLTHLLTLERTDLSEVESLLRQSLEYELQIRMAEIRLQLSVRDSLGRQKWTRLMQTINRYRESGNMAALIERAPIGSLQRRLLVVMRDMLRN